MRVDSHCSTALFVAYMLYFRPEWLVHPLISVVGPIVVAIVLAYVVSRIFMDLFIITVDTLMLCYCEEKRTGPEVTKPTQQPAQVELPPPNTVSAASPPPVPEERTGRTCSGSSSLGLSMLEVSICACSGTSFHLTT